MTNSQIYGIQQIPGAAPTSFGTWFQLPATPDGVARDPVGPLPSLTFACGPSHLLHLVFFRRFFSR